MYLKDVEIENFRNYTNQKIELDKGINVFFGDNGEGKTNLLEAIFLCSMGKSFRTSKEAEMIRLACDSSQVTIHYQKQDREGSIKAVLQEKKQFFSNGVRLKKVSELLGKIHTVLFTPDDMFILKGGPSQRRRFLDMMIGQLRPNYVSVLNLYLRTMEQRNNYLKQIKLEKKQEDLLDIWDEKLAEYGEQIYSYRNYFMEKIKEKINLIHWNITKEKETLTIEYLSDSLRRDEIIKQLKRNRKIDILKGYTSCGIHRDDFRIFINDKQVNIYGSQGQHRSVILSLKLAELSIVQEEIGEYPILLLDDFMSELDEKRRNQFLEKIEQVQVLITCTDRLLLQKKDNTLFQVEKGSVHILNI